MEFSVQLVLTARQYGEVVLPDAGTGQGPGTLACNCHSARRVWRGFCRHGTNFIEFWRDRGTSLIGAANLSPVTKFGGGHWRSVAPALTDRRERHGVQTISEPEICHGAGFKLRADERFDSRSFSEGWCPGARTITNLS